MDIDEHLARVVEKHPVIYDMHHKHYKNNGFRRKVWIEISQEIGLSAEIGQRKWKRLRERYANFLKKGLSSKKPMPVILQTMNYLKPFIDLSQTQHGIKYEHTMTNSPADNLYGMPDRTAGASVEGNEFGPDRSLYTSALQSVNEEYDGVDYFCLSVAKDLKNMPANEQRRIKLQISKLLADANYLCN